MSVRNVQKIFPEMSPATRYWITHGTAFAFLWAFHGLVLPLTMAVPWKTSDPKKSPQFYVLGPNITIIESSTASCHQPSTSNPPPPSPSNENSNKDNKITFVSPSSSPKSALRSGNKEKVTVKTGRYCDAKSISLAGRASVGDLPGIV